MWIKVKVAAAKVWDFAKRVFGRSRTIFVNIFGVLSIIFVESSDYLLAVHWDDLFKHTVAVVIAISIQLASVYLRVVTKGPVSFKADPPKSNDTN